MPDWNKEMKFSDLFGRKAKEPKDAAAETPGAVEADAPPERKSLLKKEISFSLRRKHSVLDEDAGPEPRRSRGEARAARKAERAAAKAAKKEARAAGKAAKPSGGKKPRLSSKAAPPVPAVPLMRAFNLLPREELREGKGRRATPAQLGIAVAALVGIAVLGAYFLMLSAKVADKRAEADSLRTAAAAHPQPGAQAPNPQDEVDTQLQAEQAARTAALAGALGKRIAWDRLLREFSLVVPDDVSLTKIIATGGGVEGADPATPPAPGTSAPESTFTIEGYTKTQEAVARLLARLSVLPELKSVALTNATSVDLEGVSVVQFQIQTTVKPSTGATA